MDNFEQYRKQAEQFLGKEVVDDLERELLEKARESESGVRVGHVFRVEKVRFSDEEESSKAKSPPEVQEFRSREEEAISEHKDSQPIQGLISKDPVHESHSAELIAKAVKGEYTYGMLGLVLGLAAIVGGIMLGLHGVAGSTSWTAKLLGLESRINDAAPGVVLFVVGIFYVWITKPKVHMKDLKG